FHAREDRNYLWKDEYRKHDRNARCRNDNERRIHKCTDTFSLQRLLFLQFFGKIFEVLMERTGCLTYPHDINGELAEDAVEPSEARRERLAVANINNETLIDYRR